MKSFVDLLFILLCSTIVMLSRSVEVGAVEMQPAKVGSGNVSAISADDIRVIAVSLESIECVNDDGSSDVLDSIDQVKERFSKDKCILLSASQGSVTHQRMMQVWSRLVGDGYVVKLAAVEDDEVNNNGGK
jgi:hypothetical protein